MKNQFIWKKRGKFFKNIFLKKWNFWKKQGKFLIPFLLKYEIFRKKIYKKFLKIIFWKSPIVRKKWSKNCNNYFLWIVFFCELCDFRLCKYSVMSLIHHRSDLSIYLGNSKKKRKIKLLVSLKYYERKQKKFKKAILIKSEY